MNTFFVSYTFGEMLKFIGYCYLPLVWQKERWNFAPEVDFASVEKAKAGGI